MLIANQSVTLFFRSAMRMYFIVLAVATLPIHAFLAPASLPSEPQKFTFHPWHANIPKMAEMPEVEDSNISLKAEAPAPHRRRIRYSGRYPRNFSEKYKEHRGDVHTISKVLSKGNTPAGSHVPIMVKECLHYLGLDFEEKLLVVDCTLGYGGHSLEILKCLVGRGDGSRLIAFDQDGIEIQKTDDRLRRAIKENLLSNITDETLQEDADHLLTTVNQNFQTLGTYLSSIQKLGQVNCLLADLGCSSMQIDDNDRGFTYKRSGPLDMRMNPSDTESAHDLLRRLRVRQLKSLLKENSDEVFAAEIAVGLIGKGNRVPETTVELADRVRDIVRPLMGHPKNKKQRMEMKKELDSTVARVMQAIRIEVNQEFQALEKLLEDIPHILAPGGKAVFLTFHSGEDRRVKKSFKAGFKSGIYSAWSRDVVRPTREERRDNPRSSCCKLRWAIRSDK